MPTFEKRVVSGLDDVEQAASGTMSLTSGDLNLGNDGSKAQTVAIRFTNIDIPQGAIITSAYLQFQTDEAGSSATSLLIRGEDADDAAAFANVANNVSLRTKTDAAASWSPAAWTTVGEAGLTQRTPDLSAIVQEVVSRGGWAALNDMAFIITGTGERTAESFDGGAARAPLLHVEYVMPGPPSDLVGNISIGDVSISEGDSGTKTATFTVSRAGGSAAFTVDYATANGTASAGSDYVARSGTLAFAAGQMASQDVTVTINGDTTMEANETFFVNLTNLTSASGGGSISDSQGQGTITNDEQAPVVGNISIGDVSISEGDSGTKTATFTVSRAGGSAAFTVDYATANGTASAGSDYVARSSTLAFAAGQMASQDVTVTINGDTAIEANETFYVNLTNLTSASGGGSISDSQGQGTITNDDGAPAALTFEKRVVSGLDDVEQAASGTMSLTSGDLNLGNDGSKAQTVAIRFTNIDIPQGAIITSAYLQFQTDEAGSGATSLLIRGEDADDAAAFAKITNNVSLRTKTDAAASWSPAAWTTVGEAGLTQRTPDLSAIVQEVVSRGGWAALNDMAFIITGTGERTAESFDGGAARAPLLHVEYVMPTGSNATPTLDLDASATGTGYAATFTENAGGVAIADVDVLIADADDSNMERATLTLTNAQAGDQLLVNAAALPAGITVSSASTATTVILTGSAPIADYQTALRQVSFNSTSENPATTDRLINVTVNDGIADSNTAVATIAIDAPQTLFRFAVFGDFGDTSTSGEQAVAALVAGWNVDFILTAGDNAYGSSMTYDQSVGQYYWNYIGNYSGAHGSGSAINRFFPVLGNHDYSDTGLASYLAYFTLPDVERYYDFQAGSVHFFALNSNSQEPDGNEPNSAQAQWLQAGLTASDAAYNVIFFHHTPYTSGGGGDGDMRWPFEAWEADAVFAGHAHDFDLVLRDDNSDGVDLPYITTGRGGAGRSPPDAGANLVTVTESGMLIEFYTVDGALFDSHFISAPVGGNPLFVNGNDLMNGGASSDYLWGLGGNDALNGFAGDDMLIGGDGDDVFVFGLGDGRDTIADFIPGLGSGDRLDLTAFGIATAGAFQQVATNQGPNILLNLGGGDQITLLRVQEESFIDDDFLPLGPEVGGISNSLEPNWLIA